MHGTPNRIRSLLSPLPEASTPDLSFTAPVAEGEHDCSLFLLCERIADRFVHECLQADDPQSVRRRLERKLRRQFRLNRERTTALFDLALELRHLQVNGCYRKPIAEIGRLIALVSGTELRPEDN